MSNQATIDVESILKRLGGDRTIFGELVDIFIQETPVNLKTIRDGIASNDPSAVRRGSHTLKGALGYIGTPEAMRLADELEKTGRSGNLQGAAELLQQLEESVIPIQTALANFNSNAVPRTDGHAAVN